MCDTLCVRVRGANPCMYAVCMTMTVAIVRLDSFVSTRMELRAHPPFLTLRKGSGKTLNVAVVSV